MSFFLCVAIVRCICWYYMDWHFWFGTAQGYSMYSDDLSFLFSLCGDACFHVSLLMFPRGLFLLLHPYLLLLWLSCSCPLANFCRELYVFLWLLQCVFILFLARRFTISCCVVASLIESGFRLAMFSVLSPFSILIVVFFQWRILVVSASFPVFFPRGLGFCLARFFFPFTIGLRACWLNGFTFPRLWLGFFFVFSFSGPNCYCCGYRHCLCVVRPCRFLGPTGRACFWSVC